MLQKHIPSGKPGDWRSHALAWAEQWSSQSCWVTTISTTKLENTCHQAKVKQAQNLRSHSVWGKLNGTAKLCLSWDTEWVSVDNSTICKNSSCSFPEPTTPNMQGHVQPMEYSTVNRLLWHAREKSPKTMFTKSSFRCVQSQAKRSRARGGHSEWAQSTWASGAARAHPSAAATALTLKNLLRYTWLGSFLY